MFSPPFFKKNQHKPAPVHSAKRAHKGEKHFSWDIKCELYWKINSRLYLAFLDHLPATDVLSWKWYNFDSDTATPEINYWVIVIGVQIIFFF